MKIKISVWEQNTYSTTGFTDLASLTTLDRNEALEFIKKYNGKGTFSVTIESMNITEVHDMLQGKL